MIVTMHQPEHLPWLGFFHKMALADLYVILDTCQYRRQYFQNRNLIRGVQDAIWVKVPVRKSQPRYGPIREVAIDNTRAWRKTYWGSIEYQYHNHPYFDLYAPDLKAIIFEPFDTLALLNLVLIDFFREALGITTPMVRMSSLEVLGAKGDLILTACQAVGASTYLSGPFGRDYLDVPKFTEAGIGVRYHEFAHPAYPQKGRGRFTPRLSTLDLLMNCGPDSADYLWPGRLEASQPASSVAIAV